MYKETSNPALETGEDIVVLIGGGTGVSTCIRALRSEGSLLPASITGMHDRGGRSKILRDVHGTLPPGDFIRAVLAHQVASEEVEQRRQELLAFAYPDDGSPFANYTAAHVLFAFCEKCWGRAAAVNIFPRLWGEMRGWPYPATVNDVDLAVELSDGRVIVGEGDIDTRDKHDHAVIVRHWLEPADGVVAYPPALEAIKHPNTRLIVLTMGDFYTSHGGIRSVPLISDAIRQATHAKLVYWVNLMEKKAETPGWDAATFLEKLLEHDIGRDRVAATFVNVGSVPKRLRDVYREKDFSRPVAFNTRTEKRMRKLSDEIICNDYIDRRALRQDLIRHDEEKVAEDLVHYLRHVR